MAKLALYHPWIYLKGGAERTILELVRNSKHNWTILTSYYDENGTFPEFKSMNVRVVGKASVSRTYKDTVKSVLSILFARCLFKYDAVLVSSEGVGDLFTLFHHGPFICYCHTPLKILSDPETKARYMNRNVGIFTWIKYHVSMPLFLTVDRIAWKRYSYIFSNSHEVKRRISKVKLAPPDRIEVLNPAVSIQDSVSSHERNTDAEPFLLIPGRVKWTKNIETAIRGYLKSTAPVRNIKLKIAGYVDEGSHSYLKELQGTCRDTDMVEFITNPSDEELFHLYRDCHSVLFAAPNEDWGIVVLEGLSHGKPVIAVNRGGPTEIITHMIDGILVENSAEAFAGSIDKLLDTPQLYGEICACARTTASRYSWKSFAERVDQVVDLIAAEVSQRKLDEGSHFHAKY